MHRSVTIDHQARAITWERTDEDCATALVLLADPDCSLATASYLFWAVQPLDYLTRNLDEPCKHGDANTPWTVICEAVRGAQLRRFPNSVAYDPVQNGRPSPHLHRVWW